MGGFGSAIQGIICNKNNLSKLKRKNIFKKPNDFFDASKKGKIVNKGKLTFKKASTKELSEYKVKLKKDFKRERIRNISVLLVTSLLLGFVIFKITGKAQATFTLNENLLVQEKLAYEKSQFEMYIEIGDRYYSLKNYHNAQSNYQNALIIFPEDYNANVKSILSKLELCKLGDYYRNSTLTQINEIIKVYPDSLQLLKLKAAIYNVSGNKKEEIKVYERATAFKKTSVAPLELGRKLSLIFYHTVESTTLFLLV